LASHFIPRYAQQRRLQSDQKERRIRLARIWQTSEAEEEGAHGFQSQNAAEDQDPAKTNVKFRVAKAAKDAILGVNK
jgi:hypothetical protein